MNYKITIENNVKHCSVRVRDEKFVLHVVHLNLLDRLLLAAPINIWPYLLFPNFGFFLSGKMHKYKAHAQFGYLP